MEEDSAPTTSGDFKTLIGDVINDTEKTALEESAAFLQQLHLSRKAERDRAAAASLKAVVDKPKKGPKSALVDESEDDLLDALIAENKVQHSKTFLYLLSYSYILYTWFSNNVLNVCALENCSAEPIPSFIEATFEPRKREQ